MYSGAQPGSHHGITVKEIHVYVYRERDDPFSGLNGVVISPFTTKQSAPEYLDTCREI